MKATSLIFIVILFYGCSRNIIIVGKYADKGNPDIFQFKADSTFSYNYNAFHVREYSEGKWVRLNSKLILIKSTIQTKTIPLSINYGSEMQSENYTLMFNFNSDLEIKNYKCAVFINDTLHTLNESSFLVPTKLSADEFRKEINIDKMLASYIRCDSLISVKINTPIKGIYLQLMKCPIKITSNYIIRYPLETEKCNLVSGNANVFLIHMSFKDSLFNYQVFKNEKLKVSRNGVYMMNTNNNSWWYIPKFLDK